MASRGVNKVTLMGNLGADPDLRYMPDGTPVANFSLATSEVWKDKDTQELREKTEWHRCVAFGKQAEVIQKHFHKGSKIYVEGRLQTRKWEDQNGIDRYTTEIMVREFQFVSGNADGGNRPPPMGDKTAPSATGSQASSSPAATTPQGRVQAQPPRDNQPEPPMPYEIPPGGAAGLDDDDIPF